MRFKPGIQLYKYHLKRYVGEGNFGEVWLAEDQSVRCDYAIKILKPGVRIPDFLREAVTGHQLNHDNVVRVHYADFVKDSTGSYPIIVMDYMSNGSIIQLANPASFLELPTVIRLGRDILNGLGYLHTSKFIHLDIKPGNVLTGPRGRGVISDYGIAEPTQNGISWNSTSMYVFHMAPEFLKSKPPTVRTDIYQVGLTLFRMLVRLDWLEQKYDQLGEKDYSQAIVDGDLISRSDFPVYVPNSLRRIILKAIDPDPTKRFSSALEMRRELEKLNYPGHWTIADNGDFVGINGKYRYYFNKEKISRTRYNVVARKCHTTSELDTRCREFCHSNLTNLEATKKINKFIKAVTVGI